MRTIEDAAAVETAWARAVRDLRLLRRLARLVWSYSFRGALIRRRYRQKERRGEVFYVDEELGG